MQPFTLADGTLAGLRQAGGQTRVLALHGWQDNAHSFLPLAEHLPGLDLVCLDLPGHGLSAHRPPGTRYHLDDYVWDVLAAADALEWPDFHLLGHSLGGAVSTLIAAAAPRRVRSLALIEGLGPLSAPATATAQALRDAAERSRLRPRRHHASLDAAARARAANGDLGPEAAHLLARRGTEQTAEGWRWRHDPRLGWPSARRYTEPQILDILAAIDAPVLNMHSQPFSAIMPAPLLHRRLAALRRGRVMSAPGGHHLHMKHPEILAPAILEHCHAEH